MIVALLKCKGIKFSQLILFSHISTAWSGIGNSSSASKTRSTMTYNVNAFVQYV
jgi:hypothetical protein